MIHFYKRNNVQTESDRLDRPERELDPSSQKFLSEVCTTLKRHENQHLEASESGVFDSGELRNSEVKLMWW